MSDGDDSGLRPPALQAEALLGALADHDVEFVIIGGFALAAHGVVRGTKDIDIVPDPQTENVARTRRGSRSEATGCCEPGWVVSM